MKYFIVPLVSAVALLFCACGNKNASASQEAACEELPDTSFYEYGIPLDAYDVEEGTIKSGQFFSTLLSSLGVPSQEAYDITEKSKGVFDLKQIRVGNEYHAFFTKEEDRTLAYLVYEIDMRSYVVFRMGDSLSVTISQRDVTRKVDYAEVVINSSLWDDVSKSGAPILLAVKLADIYAWTIDFFGLQKGDSFRTVYETVWCEDKLLSVENVYFTSFVHDGKSYDAYFFENEDGGNRYWNEKGESMRKAFLKAPLNFTRISSGFTYHRKHPVTRQVRPHTGIDYAAPTGTPVMTIGDGTVVFVGRKGNEGNMVKIKHNSVYTTAYLHLSKFGKGIKTGVRVRQGQVIGYVGSTGRSTGPHLDFRIWKNGTPVNPLKMESPPSEPISKSRMPLFEAAKASARGMRDSIAAEDMMRTVMERVKE